MKSTIKTQLIVTLACLVLFLAVKDKDAAFLATTAIALVSALAAESIILYFRTRALRITESSLITGLIIGFVLSADEAWWTFALAALLAVLSKHLIRLRGRHIFNPAAFGIFLTLVLFGASTQWKGTYSWYVLVPLGSYFAWKIRKTQIIIGYAVVFLALFGVQALLQDVALRQILGYLSYFFIFVMLIEPLTSPVRPMGKYIFGAGVAGLIFVLTELGTRFDVELFSLLAMNAAVPLFNRLPAQKGVLV